MYCNFLASISVNSQLIHYFLPHLDPAKRPLRLILKMLYGNKQKHACAVFTHPLTHLHVSLLGRGRGGRMNKIGKGTDSQGRETWQLPGAES